MSTDKAAQEVKKGIAFERFFSQKEVTLLQAAARLDPSKRHAAEEIAEKYNSDPRAAEAITLENAVGELNWLADEGLIRKEQTGVLNNKTLFGISASGTQLNKEIAKAGLRGNVVIRTTVTR